jgi:hypothetical protein
MFLRLLEKNAQIACMLDQIVAPGGSKDLSMRKVIKSSRVFDVTQTHALLHSGDDLSRRFW